MQHNMAPSYSYLLEKNLLNMLAADFADEAAVDTDEAAELSISLAAGLEGRPEAIPVACPSNVLV